MKTLIHHILRSSLVIVALLFIGITSAFGQFPMGNTLAPLPGNKYPIVFSNDIKGGHYQVADIDARDAIYTERRLEGMLCTVLNDGSGSMKTYQLVGGTANTDWQEFSVNATTTDVIKVGSLAPTPAVSGDVYYNTTDNQFREYNGSAWVVVSSVPTGGALPGTAAEGDIFYNTTDHKLYFYNGTAWTELGGATIADNTISASKLQGSDGNALGTGTSGWLLQSDGTGKFSWLDTSGGLPVDPTSITLAQGSFLVGAASGKAAATAKTAIPISGFGAATADVAMGNQKITGLATPTAATDAATMGYVDGKTLDGLSNVNIGTKANNDLLFWDVASSKWINKTITDAGLDQSGTNEGALTVLAGTATTSLISSNTSGSTDVTIEVGGINSISETANKITITGTEVDGDPTNEVQYLTAGGTTSPTITLNEISAVGGGVITFEGAGGTTLSQNSGTITITSGSGTTDLSYDAATRTVASSTGDDAVLPTVDGTNAGLMSSTDKTKLDEITATGSGQIITDVERTKLSGLTNYTLPTASTTTLGGVKIDGTSVTIDGNGVISAQGSAAVQSELDATQTGAGLTTTGAYSANGSTNYLQAASSLKDADEKLDAQIKTVADAVATKGNGTVTEVQGTADRISVTDGTTVPVVDIASTYAGQSSITTLGTVTTGTWNGSVIAPAYGGTGVDNGTNTITLGGNLTTTVGNVQLNSAPGGSTVTLPSSGTLVSTTDLAAGVSPIGSTLNSGKIIVGSSENKAAAVDMGGDATIDDAGALTIENARVTAAKLTAGAGAADRVAVADAAGVVTYGSLPAGALPSSIDATKIGNGTVSSTEFQTLSDINTGQTVQTQLNSKASQSELDATQTGAGLDTDGSYSANASTNYLKTANSLKDADEKLDTQLKAIADGYVPYTGATGNVDLGTNNIIANSIRLTSGAQNGYILKSDASGNASWQAATSAYKGTWNADTNTPAIADGTGSTGDYYLVSVSGTQFGRSFVQGGQAVYNGTIWESIATSQAVSSVNGLTGAVQINPGLSGNTLSLTGGTLTVDLSTATAVAAATTKGNDLQSELDATQAGAGLAIDGAYAANGSTNYIQTATSLKDADEKLDTQIKTVTDAVNSLSSGSLSGDVSGTLSTTSVDKIKGVSLGTTTATSGNVLVGSGTTWETRTVSGDVTISGTGVTAIGTGAVTLAKMANMATSSLIYRKTAGTGAPEVQTLATLKTDLGLTGTNSGDQTITLTGNVTGSGTGSFATTIANNAVTYAKMQTVTASRLLGNPTASAAVPSEISIGSGLSLTTGGVLSATGTGGTVTSVGLSLPSIFTVSNSPVTDSGTLTGTLASQTSNYVFAAPSSGNGTPVFRALVAGDLPSIDLTSKVTGILPIANGGTGSSTKNFVDLTTTQTVVGAKTWSNLGTFSAGVNLSGSTSGYVGFAAPATVTSYTLTLPSATGGNGQVLQTNGSGVLSWVTPSSGVTNLGQGTLTGTTVPLTSSSGTGTTLAAATTTVAGVMSAADKTKLDGIATGANNYSHPNHTGDVTSVGDGVTTIVAGAVTLAKMANMATSSLIYRKTAGTGSPEVQTLATLKTDLGLTGTNSGDQTITLTGNVTGSGTGSFATTIANNAVTYAKMQTVTASRLLGNPTASAAVPSEISIGSGLSLTTGGVLSATGTGGTVTSVGLSLPSIFTVSNSPVTDSGTLTGTLASQTSNYVFAAPSSGNGTPVFRALVAGDLPSIDLTSKVTGILPIANGGTGSSTKNFVDLTTTQTVVGAKTWSNLGTFSAGVNLSGSTSGYVGFAAPATVTSYTLTLPSATGGNGQVLQTNGSGVLSWVNAATGTVTNVATGTGLTGGPITGTGTISMADMAALSVKGNATNASAAPTDIAAGTDGYVLRRSGTTLGFGTVATAGIANNAVDGTKINLTSNAIGDLMYYNGTDWVRLPAGTAGQTLQANGANAPIWTSVSTDVFDAAITGNINGTNQVFTLPSTFVAGTTRVFLNGLRLKRGATVGVGYYQETGTNQITFGVAPQSGDVIIVDYKH